MRKESQRKKRKLKLKVDHYYHVGDSHDECQDYALSRIWENGLAFTCIADGCSSSHQKCRAVDVGARILSYSAEHLLKGFTRNVDNKIENLYNTFFLEDNQSHLGDLIGLFAKNTINHLMEEAESEYALDSTLLIAIADEKDALVFVFGDGVVAVEREDGRKDIYEVRYSNSAPYYISYIHDKNRRERYELMKNEISLIDLESGEDEIIVPGELGIFHSAPSLYVKDYKSISIMSDGFTSFVDGDNNSIDTGVIVNKAIGFKNHSGVFQQRRMKMMLKRLKRKGFEHYDDLSIASIVNE